MRAIVLSGARSCLVAFLTFSLTTLPVMAAEKPLGMIVAAEHAQLDNTKAATGADVYSGDALITEPNGSLRMQIGSSQMFLIASSSATLVPQDNTVQANVDRGTVGFSTPGQLEIGTPVGVVRSANGQRVLGQVTILSPTSVRIGAYEGALLVKSADGEEKTIEQGQAYEATLMPESEPGGNGQVVGVGHNGTNWRHVTYVAVPLIIFGIIALILWHIETESCSKPGCK